MDTSEYRKQLFTPRMALYANLGLVFAGSVLGLLGLVDIITGAILVVIGFVGIAVVLLGSGE